MDLTFDSHAMDRMSQRGVTSDDVEWAIRRQIREDAGEPGTIWIVGYAAGRRILKVCVRTDDKTYVITVAWEE